MFQFVSQYEYHVIEPSITHASIGLTRSISPTAGSLSTVFFTLCAYDVECSDDDGKFRRTSAADR